MEELLSKEIFSKVQEVVKEIITEGRCEDVNGSEFYERLLSKLGFFTGLIIRPNQEFIVSTFNSKIGSIRIQTTYLKNYCSLEGNIDDNVNNLISLFLKGNIELKKSWDTYIRSKSGGGRRKTKTCNKKKTKKIKRIKYK